mmetsp:Transcript_50052/g.134697  ORF Transcript_50052/g.134697 Transcript_50052/m.134697 type:complete len:279 (-) Transcript_50052:5558-6394(-)
MVPARQARLSRLRRVGDLLEVHDLGLAGQPREQVEPRAAAPARRIGATAALVVQRVQELLQPLAATVARQRGLGPLDARLELLGLLQGLALVVEEPPVSVRGVLERGADKGLEGRDAGPPPPRVEREERGHLVRADLRPGRGHQGEEHPRVQPGGVPQAPAGRGEALLVEARAFASQERAEPPARVAPSRRPDQLLQQQGSLVQRLRTETLEAVQRGPSHGAARGPCAEEHEEALGVLVRTRVLQAAQHGLPAGRRDGAVAGVVGLLPHGLHGAAALE